MNRSDSLHRLERIVLPLVTEGINLKELVDRTGLKDIEVQRALQWLENKELVKTTETKAKVITLDKNGLLYAKEGLPEMRALKLLKDGSLSTRDLVKKGISKDEINIIIGTLKKKAAIDIAKEGGAMMLSITDAGEKFLSKPSLEEQFLKSKFPKYLDTLKPEEQFVYENLRKRKDILLTDTIKTVTTSLTEQGKELVKKGISQDAGIDRLTPQMLKQGTWKKKKFRPYDVSINVPKLNRGRQHFVNEAINYAKRIWLDMGFVEMTGDHVQTAFWDLDSLFVPQDHPAREMQDTYYIKDPKSGRQPDKKIWDRVRKVHEDGGDTGSKGWQTPYDKGMALLNLLRTHTTVLSARTISKLKKGDMPAKFFTIGKVYRNESLDWKHLFEFHQVEGIVIDPNANLRDLKGYLESFYRKMGFTKVRMRPAHFPYTEPSIEPEVWHPVKKEWIEMGGAGIFRPEVTKTLIGVEVPVLAWGLGLERIIAPYYNINDIRELYNNDLKQLRIIKNYIR